MTSKRDRFHLVRLTGTLCAVADMCNAAIAAGNSSPNPPKPYSRGLIDGADVISRRVIETIDEALGGELQRYRAKYWSMKPRNFTVLKGGKPKPRK